MNVVISGPFGGGSLADEIVLAGVLRHLREGKHTVTVLTPSPEHVHAIHQCDTVQLHSPTSLLSTPKAWEVLEKAHLFVLASAGVLSAEGKPEARGWLSQFEHAKRMNAKTMVLGMGAVPIENAKERVRLQRWLHNFTDGLSSRDQASKLVMTSYGLSTTRISNNGDPVLALLLEGAATRQPATPRVGIVLAQSLPSRTTFGLSAAKIAPELSAALGALLKKLLEGSGLEVRLFHDDTAAGRSAAQELTAKAPGRIECFGASIPIEKLQTHFAGCSVIFSLSLHGLIFGAVSGALVTGPDNELGAREFLTNLGLAESVALAQGNVFDVPAALASIHALLQQNSQQRQAAKAKLSTLCKREAQNRRLIELLVPQRERYPERPEKFKKKRQPKERSDKDVWFDQRFE